MKILIHVILGLDLLYIVVMYRCRDVPPRKALRGGRDERYSHYLHIPQEKL